MSDKELQEHVQNALAWDPSIDDNDIGVSVDGGVVALRGVVGTFSEKAAAERVTLGIYGVRGVANDLAVKPGHSQERTDMEVAQDVLTALKLNGPVPEAKISVVVSDGWVTLKGVVSWEYQRAAAASTVRDITGVRGVTNLMTLEPHVQIPDVKSKIEAALKRSAEVDARRINVAVVDGKVILSGSVRSWFEKDEARNAAWSAPGVKDIDDRIMVVP
jgi:osmotically-inducible protein OsmY